ncbi:G1 family endopeptidase [Comamonadaceae bacterium G21597-S1]|nr:G1 family endopeptidase [Comamonadaceae bacterium G21597-S1]
MSCDLGGPGRCMGCVNPDMPPQPTPATPSDTLFLEQAQRRRYWLPDPPGAGFPTLQDFWDRLRSGITEYRRATTITGPDPTGAPIPATVRSAADLNDKPIQLGRRSRVSHSPNWSGASVAAVDSSTLTQIVGRWIEPVSQPSGTLDPARTYRSSLWIGFNGHAAYRDAAMPQIGTLQEIVYANGGWQPRHWVWFEWWADSQGGPIDPSVLPCYLDLPVQPGDTVWCRVDLVPSDPACPAATFPHVARLCVCVEHPADAASPASKILVMPFVIYPPVVDAVRVKVTGSTANWIAELPSNVWNPRNPWLLPRLRTGVASDQPVTFAHCAAASARDPGAPLIAEHTLAVSRRFHMYSGLPRGDASLKPIATCLMPRISDTAFAIQVDGNDA